jgi:hypothetical protein
LQRARRQQESRAAKKIVEQHKAQQWNWLTTAESLAAAFGVDPDNTQAMLGMTAIAEGLINLRLIARAHTQQH